MNIKAAILFAIAVTPMASQAAIISGYGAYASTSTASNCPSYCTGDFQYDNAGAEFSTTASSAENSYATTRAYSSISDGSYLPTLRVETVAGENRGGFATAFGAQGFTYTGAEAFNFTLNYNLHGSVGANPTGSISRNSLRGDVAVLIGSGLEWYPSYATLVYEVAYDFIDGGRDSLFINSGDNVNTSGSFSFMLNPGDEFYVIGSMGANSVDGFVDGWNTMTMDFVDDTGLTAVSAVPVPAAVWLFASGLVGLISIARRKQA